MRVMKLQKRLRGVRKNYELFLFALPAFTYFLIFHYFPMYGVQIAFKDFTARSGILGSKWVGLKHFTRFFNLPSCWQLIANTLSLSMYTLIVGFPMPILLALALHELTSMKFKRTVQTVSYAPHFISMVVMVSMIQMFGHKDYGILNKLTGLWGAQPVSFMGVRQWFRSVYVLSGVWQSTGWSSIVYLSALSSIDPQLHESAMIDGATRLERIWHINLPSILPTIAMLFILQSGSLMSVGFEKAFLMQNPVNLEVSEVISTYVYKIGLLQTQFSFSAAVGLFNSVANCALLLSTNFIARRLTGSGLF